MIIQVVFADYLAIFSRRMTSSLVQSQLANHGKLKALPYSVLCKAIVQQKIWVVCQAARDWRPCSVLHSMHCAALLLIPVLMIGTGINIWRRHQHEFELAEYCGEMDSVSLLMTQSSLEVPGKQILFLCVMTPSSPKRFV